MATDRGCVSQLPVGLEEVLVSDLLAARPARVPDYPAENRALVSLARQLAAAPETVLQRLTETALELCRAGSAGISIEEVDEQGEPVFRWHAVAGRFAPFLGATLPRHFSPCGIVLDRRAPQLLADPARFYPYIAELSPPVAEVLLIPFYEGARPIGTIWVVAHDGERVFDSEDARLMTSLAEFAALGRKTELSLAAIRSANNVLKKQQTDRDLVLDEAERERKRLYDVFHKAPAFMAVLRGPDHVFELANDRYYQTVGHRELLGKALLEALPEVADQGYVELLDHVYQSGEMFVGSDTGVWLQREPGQPLEVRYVDFIYQPLTDADGQVTGILALGIDLTARKQAEAALRSSEERYRSLFNSIDEGFCLIELQFDDRGRPIDYRFLEVNPAFERHTGLKDAIGKTARGMLPTLDEYWFETYGRVALTGEPVRFVNHAPALEDRWYDVYAFRFGGADSRKVALLFNDISQRKRVEQAMEASEGRLQLAVEIAKMGTFEIDLVTDAVIVNEPGREIYGWQSLHNTFTQVQAHFHPEDRAAVVAEVTQALSAGGPGTFDVEQRIIRTDQQVRWIRVRGRAVAEGTGATRRITKCIGTYLDITERKQVEEALRESDRRKDEFLALLAHELRNPLAPIRNGLQVMRLAADQPATIAQTREMMERQLAHMVRLIDDLLDVSRISRNKMELRPTRVALADVLSIAVETVRPMIDAARHTLRLSLPTEPILMDADVTRLSQVFSNLLANSAKYTPPGGALELSATLDGEQVVILVRDNGIGIPQESLRTIFEMFSQVDRRIERTTGGLGIGLALVRGLVALHGGSVRADSPGPGQGTTITVRLPAVTAPRLVEPTAPAVEDERTPQFALRVLVVDDNRDSCTTMAMLLRLLGNEVNTAFDGLEAVELVEQTRPDVVLMDVGMPRLNGYDATRRIRALPGGHNVSIIAVTGWGQETDRAQSVSAGCDGHLVKPVSRQDLQDLLAGLTAARGRAIP